ncbi:hypothetical protein [Richelia sinica]|nr:hypothetical protein [Richelia sinica]MBD2665649.1 hypothetical protein [Richelia sinica FACHB-800]
MGINLKAFSGLLMLLTTTALPATAQVANYQTTNDVFDRAFFRFDSNFYNNNTPQRQLDSLVGVGLNPHDSFTDNEIVADAELVNSVYRDVLAKQATEDPYLRTPDLPTPYDTSLLMSPRYNANKLKIGTEYRFETLSTR